MPHCTNSHEIPIDGGYCQTCAKCSICSQSLTVTEYQYCLRQYLKEVVQDHAARPDFTHPSCLTAQQKEILANATVTIPKILFDKLNAARLLLEPDMELSEQSNEEMARIGVDKALNTWLYKASFEEIALMYRRAVSVASALHLALQKQRRDIGEVLEKRDNDRVKQAVADRKKEEKRKAILDPAVDLAAYQAAKLAESEAEAKKVAGRQIEKLMKATGMTFAEAAEQVAESVKKAAARRGVTIQ